MRIEDIAVKRMESERKVTCLADIKPVSKGERVATALQVINLDMSNSF